LVRSNAFVRNVYPNFELLQDLKTSRPQGLKTSVERLLSLGPAQLAERTAQWLYGWHLRRRSATWQSREQVRLEPECLKLHTSSHRASIMARFDHAMLDALQGVDEDSRCEVIASRS